MNRWIPIVLLCIALLVVIFVLLLNGRIMGLELAKAQKLISDQKIELKEFAETKTQLKALQIKLRIAQNTPTLSVEEVSLLSRLIYSESNLEPLEGKIAVAETIFNRMRNQNMTLKEVIYQPGQFDGVYTKNFNYTSEECLRAVELFQDGVRSLDDDYVWYVNKDIATDSSHLEWLEEECEGKQIGNHTFYKLRKE